MVPVRLLFVKLLERIKMFYYQMATKLMMIDFRLPRTNQVLQGKLANWYINRDGNGIEYTIGVHKDIDKM